MKYKNIIKLFLLFLIPHGLVISWRRFAPFIHARGRNDSEEKYEFDYGLSNLRSYKNSYREEECFLIGAGSSIQNQNLDTLVGKKCITVSNVYVHPAIKFICPVCHVLPNIFSHHTPLYGKEKFVTWLIDMHHTLPESTKMVMDIKDKNSVTEFDLFEGREILWYGDVKWNERSIDEIIPESLPHVWSVSETALIVAIYMGFSPLYLLGIDHDWFNGIFNYFFDHKTQHKVGLDESKVKFADSEFQMRRHAYIFKKYKELYRFHGAIYNCNSDKNSYVDVFPKLDLNKVLARNSEKFEGR